ncbi:MAG: helix-turn-helix domain-containing protein [Actinophytocola sp.]|uniref:helix-turn-helix domain-containing protein n=1 Tax=Actinophytocola sp. TaxID=1872138 RepID=UPI00132A2939|nr:helix-turn-helix transcriptional regulator [Actinophytocola sp.]MPZ86299.1 helix-turn-helix domain-containing protein [Actinophytocola sp.]
MAREPVEITELRRALGERLATFRKAADITQGQLATAAYVDRTTVSHVEKGRARADEAFWQTADQLTESGGQLVAAYRQLETTKRECEADVRANELAAIRAKADGLRSTPLTGWGMSPAGLDDEMAAIELARRVAASDVGDETLTRLELAFDELATAYPVTPPAELLVRLRHHLAYISTLMDGRMTLSERKRLVVVGGWLSLLAATVHVDLNRSAAATARLRTAASLAQQAGHDEVRAWCFETEAWRVLTEGNYRRALELSRAAQELAPSGSSVAIQATAQEGRAWARLRQPRETYSAIERVTKLVSPLERPDHPEHHYRYDPDKSVAYVATTLAWAGDPAAERYAREVIARLEPSEGSGKWPRRVAAANLDLALALLVTNRLDEACAAALQAMLSGRVVPSNHWRAAEVVKAVETRQLPEARDLREAYEELRRGEPDASAPNELEC